LSVFKEADISHGWRATKETPFLSQNARFAWFLFGQSSLDSDFLEIMAGFAIFNTYFGQNFICKPRKITQTSHFHAEKAEKFAGSLT